MRASNFLKASSYVRLNETMFISQLLDNDVERRSRLKTNNSLII